LTEALSPTDRSSLVAERGPVNMAIGAVIVAEGGPGVGYHRVLERVEQRLHLIPRYRQRLQEPRVGVVNPVWIDDEHFDLRWHIRQASLPAPGGEAELAAYVATEASRRLDRSRPLWELHLVEGLAGHRVALVAKMHHAMVDGMAAAGIAAILLDVSEGPPSIEPPEDEWEPREYTTRSHFADLARVGLSEGQRLVLQAIDRVLETTPQEAAAEAQRATELIAALAQRHPPPPKLPINGPLSPNRAYAIASAALADIKRACKAVGGTVNDAILAAVSGMLGRYLAEAGVDPAALARDPVALVPVSIRAPGEEGGNRISVVLVDLPIGEPDPRRRIELLSERMTAIKGSAEVRAGALAIDATGFGPPLLSSVLALAVGGAGGFNLVISNVPGPKVPLFFGGSRVVAIHPVVPLNPADQRLNVGVVSYDGRVFFGLAADRDLEPQIDRAVAALEAALTELGCGAIRNA